MTESTAAQNGELLMVDVQCALPIDESDVVTSSQLTRWANLAYAMVSEKPSEVTIRLVGVDEITQLNRDYRGKDKSTNVLSFPFEPDFDFSDDMLEMGEAQAEGFDNESGVGLNLLGDIVVCQPVIIKEAGEQSKAVLDHYAHMVVHGVLHLCGYDHIQDDEAEEMEALEIKFLAQQNIANPYL